MAHTVLLVLLVTAGLSVPFLLAEPTGSASQEPAGEVFDVRDLIAERMVSDAFNIPFIAEAKEGDLLRAEPMLELLKNAEALRNDEEVGPKLYRAFEPGLGVEVHGVHTIADAVDGALREAGGGGLAEADDAQVKAVAGQMIDAVGPVALGLSDLSERDENGDWVVPAVTMLVRGDDKAVGGAPAAGAVLGVDDTTKEEFNRDVQELLRGDERHIGVWGVGFDVNLTSQEQGQRAGPFIGLVVLAVLLFVGLVYRSYWPVAVTGAALAIMIIWLRGISNAIGLENDQILSTIVPIALVSFGIDFAFHGIGRYEEHRRLGHRPGAALAVGLAAVLGALVLALATSAAAFLANTSSGIQSIIQFGIAAAVGLAAAFVLLGVVSPTVMMWIDERTGGGAGDARPPRSGGRRVATWIGGAFAASLAAGSTMAIVLFAIFLGPPIGLAVLGAHLVLLVALPVFIAGRRARRRAAPAAEAATAEADAPASTDVPAGEVAGRVGRAIGAAVGGVVRIRAVLLPVVIAGTGVCGYYATQVVPQFDVVDFFNPSSSFVVSLDKLDEHGAESGGEPAEIYLETDLTDPAALAVVNDLVDGLRGITGDGFARGDDGELRVETGVVGVLNDVVANPAATAAVTDATGVEVSDGGSGYPGTAAEVAATFEAVRADGVPFDEQRLAWTAGDVREVLWESADGSRQATVIRLYVTDSRAQESVVRAERVLAPLVEEADTALREIDPSARVVATGAPIARQQSLEAVSDALQLSLPIAIGLCLFIAVVFMRSLRYALVAIVPILLVVAWLYAFMYALGFNLNLVTATIGAISIGIGIAFAIHFAMRYRDELPRAASRHAALRISGATTGTALVASALSSIVGFGILAFAPMPLFASYGLLTAVMIVFALAASLLVLPSLLALVTRDPVPKDGPDSTSESTDAAKETTV